MMYLDLAELPRVFEGVPFWSARRRAPAWFKRSDYLSDPAIPLDEAVRNLVAAHTGARPIGPIRLLTHLRYFGYCMNPVSFYYCFGTGGRLETIVAEITNTPWKERHQYVLAVDKRTDARLKRFDFGKAFHVSPFLPMNMDYQWRFSEPKERLLIDMRNFAQAAGTQQPGPGRERAPVFEATLALKQQHITVASLLAVLAGFPLMTAKVLAAIYWQALRLWIKRTPFHSHPPDAPVTVTAAARVLE